MTIDARAYVWCSLGPLSEEGSSIVEDHAQGTGVIMYKGTINLKGVIQLIPGTVVHLAYSDGQNWIARIPIRLRVISHFCNPITDRTSVSVGCDFAYKENREPQIDPITAEEANPDADPEDWKAAPPPIEAKYIADAITCVLRLKSGGQITSITNVARANNVVTITTDPAHGMSAGDSATVAAITNTSVNGTFEVKEGSGTTFSYDLPGAAINSAQDTGSVTVIIRPPLGNKFSKQEFDLSKGPIQTLSDLMKSEGYAARMNEAGGVEYLLKDPGIGAGPVITEDDLIDFNPINSGDLPADEVVAKHEASNLKAPKEDEAPGDGSGGPSETPQEEQERKEKERERRNWEREETFGPREEYRHVWTYYDYVPTGQRQKKNSYGHPLYYTGSSAPVMEDYGEVKAYEIEEKVSFIPYSITNTKYDELDRVISRITDTNTLWGIERTETWFTYEDPKDDAGQSAVVPFACTLPQGSEPDSGPNATFEDQRPKKEVDRGEVIQERTLTWSPVGSVNLSLGLNRTFSVVRENGLQYQSGYREVNYYKDKESGITRTVTRSLVPYITTFDGSETISRERDKRNPWEGVDKDEATRLVDGGTEIRIRTERDFGLQLRPGVVDRNIDENRKTPKAEQEVKSDFVYNSSSSQNKLELSPPFAPDDTMAKDENGNYVVQKGDADQKASNYAQTENKLLHGHRNGVGIQLLPELLPSRPLQSFFIRIRGCTGAYLTNGRTWNFDPTGITLTCDASFRGAIDGTIANAWFPLPPGATSLPAPVSTTTNANPKPANAIPIPTGFNFGSPDLTALFGSLPAGVAPVYPKTISPSNLVKPYRVTIFCGAGSGSGAIADPQFWIAQPPGEYTAGSGSGVLATAVAGPSTSLGARWTSGTTFTAAAGTAGPGHGGGERWASGSVFVAGVGSDGLVRAPGARWTSATVFTAGAAEGGLVLGAGARWTSGSTFTAGAGSDDLEQAPGAAWASASVFVAGAGDDGIELGAGASWSSGSTFTAGAGDDGLEEAPGANWSSGSAFYAGVGGVGDGSGAGAAWTSGSTFTAGAGSVAETDPHFANVSLLLHMDGTEGSTTIVDSSSNAFAITTQQQAQLTTTGPKFGTASLLLDGTQDHILTPANAALQLGTSDFTVECWIYPTSANTDQGIFTFGGTSSGLFMVHDGSTFEVGTAGGGTAAIVGGTPALNTWQHVAITRSGTSLRLFVGGTQVGSMATDSTNYSDNQLKIGYSYTSQFAFAGRIDEFRVTKGIARYLSSFTPPTAPFPNS